MSSLGHCSSLPMQITRGHMVVSHNMLPLSLGNPHLNLAEHKVPQTPGRMGLKRLGDMLNRV